MKKLDSDLSDETLSMNDLPCKSVQNAGKKTMLWMLWLEYVHGADLMRIICKPPDSDRYY